MSWRARGLRPWVWQRLSALYLALTVPYLTFSIVALPGDYAAWVAWVKEPFHEVVWLGLLPAVGIHAWVGLRDVVLDYVKSAPLRMLLLSSAVFGFAALGLTIVSTLLHLEGA